MYHIAVIDFMQCWNTDKKCESLLKRVFKGRPKDLISCVPPEPYKQRFNRFIDDWVLRSKYNSFAPNTMKHSSKASE